MQPHGGEDDPEDNDEEYALRLQLLRRQGRAPPIDGLRKACVSMRAALTQLPPTPVVPAVLITDEHALLALYDSLLFSGTQASLLALHCKLPATSPPTGGDPFQQSVCKAAARPPWPGAATGRGDTGWTLREAVNLWEIELGAMLEAVYVCAPHVVLVFDWPVANEGIAFEPYALAVVTSTATGVAVAPGATGVGPVAVDTVFARVELLEEVPLLYSSGQAPEDGSDKGAVQLCFHTRLRYVTSAWVPQALASVIV